MEDRKVCIEMVPKIMIMDMTRRHVQFLTQAMDQKNPRGSFFPHSNVVLLARDSFKS